MALTATWQYYYCADRCLGFLLPVQEGEEATLADKIPNAEVVGGLLGAIFGMCCRSPTSGPPPEQVGGWPIRVLHVGIWPHFEITFGLQTVQSILKSITTKLGYGFTSFTALLRYYAGFPINFALLLYYSATALRFLPTSGYALAIRGCSLRDQFCAIGNAWVDLQFAQWCFLTLSSAARLQLLPPKVRGWPN